MSNFNKRNRFHMERLEDRQMMAGDMTAVVQNGTLFINEAPNSIGGAQELEIVQVAGNKVRLNPTQGTLINGKSSLLFESINSLNVDAKLGGGKDVVHIIGQPGNTFVGAIKIDTSDPAFSPNDEDVVTARNLTVSQLDITTGSGHDVVEVVNTNVNGPLGRGNLNIRAGINTPGVFSDQDVVTVAQTHVQHDMSLLTGASNDRVILKNVDVGLLADDLLWVDLGAQDDVLEIGSGLNDFTLVSGKNLRVDARDGNDRVVMADVFFSDGIAVQLGAGNDVLNMRNVQSRTNMALRGQEGNDTMILQQVEAFDNFFAYMGEGSDTLDITFIKARRVELDGGDGDGYDKLFFSQSPNIPTLIRRGFEEINGQKLILKATAPGPISR